MDMKNMIAGRKNNLGLLNAMLGLMTVR